MGVRLSRLIGGIVHHTSKEIGLANDKVGLLSVLQGGEIFETKDAVIAGIADVQVRRRRTVIQDQRPKAGEIKLAAFNQVLPKVGKVELPDHSRSGAGNTGGRRSKYQNPVVQSVGHKNL